MKGAQLVGWLEVERTGSDKSDEVRYADAMRIIRESRLKGCIIFYAHCDTNFKVFPYFDFMTAARSPRLKPEHGVNHYDGLYMVVVREGGPSSHFEGKYKVNQHTFLTVMYRNVPKTGVRNELEKVT